MKRAITRFTSHFLPSLQYAGDPIDCMKDHPMDGDTFDTYCWVEGTWSHRNKRAEPSSVHGVQVNKRLDQVSCFDKDEPGSLESRCWHHQFYQWVALVLVFQAECFYFPRFL